MQPAVLRPQPPGAGPGARERGRCACLARHAEDWGLRSPGLSLQAVPRLAGGFAGRAWRCLTRRWCWDPAPLALAGHGLWARCLFRGAIGCRELRGDGGGHGRRGRSPPQGPDGKAGSRGSDREGPFPRSNMPGRPQRKTGHNFCLKSSILGRFSVSCCSDVA